MKHLPALPLSARPAVLDGISLVTAIVAAVITAGAGQELGCTTLVAFALVSANAAGTSAVYLWRHARTSGANRHDDRSWATRVSVIRVVSLTAVGAYAAVNAVLDLGVPRFQPDPISFSGLACALIAVVIFALVLENKYRTLQDLPSPSLFESLPDGAFYVLFGLIAVLALAGHIVFPCWWLDTVVDALIVALVGFRLRGLLLGGWAA